jgi:hypothetical protein
VVITLQLSKTAHCTIVAASHNYEIWGCHSCEYWYYGLVRCDTSLVNTNILEEHSASIFMVVSRGRQQVLPKHWYRGTWHDIPEGHNIKCHKSNHIMLVFSKTSVTALGIIIFLGLISICRYLLLQNLFKIHLHPNNVMITDVAEWNRCKSVLRYFSVC